MGGVGDNYRAVFRINGGADLNVQGNLFSWGSGYAGGYSKFYTANTSADNRAIIRGSGARMIAEGTIDTTYSSVNYLTIIGFNSSAGRNVLYGKIEGNVTNSRFINCSSWEFGDANMITARNSYFNYNDFRNITVSSGMPIDGESVVYSRMSGTKTGVFEVKGNTIDYGSIAVSGDKLSAFSGIIATRPVPSWSAITATELIGYRGAITPALPATTNAGTTTVENSGEFVNSTSTTYTYIVEIEAGGTTFKWNENGGVYTTGVALSTSYITLNAKGLKVKFSAVTGTAGDKWSFTGPASGLFVGGGAGGMTLDGGIFAQDSYNGHGFDTGAVSQNILSEQWSGGGPDHILLANRTATVQTNLFLGVGTAINQNGQISTGLRATIKNNTIIFNNSGYLGFIEETSFKTGRVKLSSNLVVSTTAGTSNIADMTDATHREVDYTDYNALYTPNGTSDKYANMVIPTLAAPAITAGAPTKTLINSGNYSGASLATYTVTVDAGATTYTWSCSTGGGVAGVAIGAGGAYQTLNNEVYINWSAAGTVTAGDQWTFTADILSADPDANPVDGGGLHDLTGINPQFVDGTRNIAAYMTLKKGAYATPQLARRDFYMEAIKRNGLDYYGNPATYNPDFAPETVRAWVFAGYVPQSPAYKATGEGGVDIGAVPVQVPKKKNKGGFGFRPSPRFKF